MFGIFWRKICEKVLGLRKCRGRDWGWVFIELPWGEIESVTCVSRDWEKVFGRSCGGIWLARWCLYPKNGKMNDDKCRIIKGKVTFMEIS